MLRRTESTDLLTMLANLHYAADFADVGLLCDRMRKHLDISGVLLQRVVHQAETPLHGLYMGFGAYLPMCMEYRAGNMLGQDPLIRDALLRGGESHWNAYQQPSPSSQHWRLHERYGMHSGVCIVDSSMRREDEFLVVRLSSPMPRITAAQQDFIDQVVPYLARLIDRDWFRGSPNISTRQLEIGRMLRDGLSAKQVASRLHIPQRAVRHHLNRMASELGLGAGAADTDGILLQLERWSVLDT